ncbi:MAG: RNA 2',3'-cyclic phosphodiesterase [Anaerolineae bacterium]|nr:RNA 2',3'-cyclic phosphodiesterase [Anaerolineae bacterium]
MAEMWRLFIAIEIPAHVLDQLGVLQDHLKKKSPARTVRWAQPAGIHLTLKFLGDVPVIKRDTLQKALTKAVADHAPFTLIATELGCFPNVQRPRVIWVGVRQNQAALVALREAVEDHIAPLGYPTEQRTFSPHLTLGRVQRDAQRGDIQRLGDLIANTTYAERHSWPVNEVHLIRSELKPTGAEYTILFRALLQTGE